MVVVSCLPWPVCYESYMRFLEAVRKGSRDAMLATSLCMERPASASMQAMLVGQRDAACQHGHLLMQAVAWSPLVQLNTHAQQLQQAYCRPNTMLMRRSSRRQACRYAHACTPGQLDLMHYLYARVATVLRHAACSCPSARPPPSHPSRARRGTPAAA